MSIKVWIKVKPGSKVESIDFESNPWVLKVKSPPVVGKANERVIELLSKRLKIAASAIEIIKGHTTSQKQLLIHLEEEALKKKAEIL